MKPNPTLQRAITCAVLALFTSLRLMADVVETKSGARIVGKVVKIDDGAVIVESNEAMTTVSVSTRL